MARSHTARLDGFAFQMRAHTTRFSVNILERFLSEQALRRLIPYLLLLFFATLLIGAMGNYIHGKRVALDTARTHLSLIADTISANLLSSDSTNHSDWQNRLAAALPAGATLVGRHVLLTDTSGNIRATAPITAKRDDTSLLKILGENQPVTTFGAQAGVLQLTLADGSDALVTVRGISGLQVQITLIQSNERALALWRRDAVVDATLSITTGLLLLLLGAGFHWLSDRSNRAEAALAATQNSMEIAFEKSGLGLWDWNIKRGQIRVSKAMGMLLGLGENATHTISTSEISEALHPDDELLETVNEFIQSGSSEIDHRFRIRNADGSWITLRLKGSLRQLGETNETHLLCAVQPENTSHIHLSNALTEDERLHDAIEAISEAFVLWDCDNRLVMCNDKYQQFYNLSDEAVRPGASYESVIALAAAPVVHSRITVSDDNNSSAHTYEAQLEDGHWLHIDERRTKDGGYVSVGTDITSLKKSQEHQAKSEKELKATITDLRHSRRELEQQKQQLVELMEKYVVEKNRAEDANQAKSEFLANISHELRTPLNAVIGFSEVMKNGLFGPIGNQKYVEYARDIHESGKHLLEVINDVLDMSKIEAGRINLDIKSLDAGEIIEDSIRIMAPAAKERRIKVKRNGLKQLKVRADKRALKQILLNLLSNAVKFTPQEGKVTLRLSKTRGYAKITIADTGIGIPETEIGKLGRPFEQVENQLTKTRKGSGLGLAISKSLLEMHGGKLEMESSVLEGTTVICYLPLKPAPLKARSGNSA